MVAEKGGFHGDLMVIYSWICHRTYTIKMVVYWD